MNDPIAIIFHSSYGHTAAQAAAVARGAESVPGMGARLFTTEEALAQLETISRARALIFGAPTQFGAVSAEMKRFMDATGGLFASAAWRDRLAAGFTCSNNPSGDKLQTLIQLSVFAAQHGMLWVGLDALPGPENRLGSWLGAMAQPGPEGGIHPADAESAALLGRRVAQLASKLSLAPAA